MLAKEPDNFEKILKRRFEDHLIDEGRDLFPSIAENLNLRQTQGRHNTAWKYMIAASVTVGLLVGGFFLISRFSESSVNVAIEYHTPDVTDKKTYGEPDQQSENIHLSDIGEMNESSQSSPQIVQTIVEEADYRGKIVKLSDGSTIILESGSSVSYSSNFGKENRAIHLEGTAFFDVSKQEKLPFVVSTSRSVTTVLGTSFNINSSSDPREDRITVYSGLVTFSHKNAEGYLQLAAGSSAVLKENEYLRMAKHRVNANAWQSGRLVFEETKVKEVIEDLEMYFGSTVTVSDPNILNCTFSGIFLNPKIDEIISVVSLSLNLDYEEKHDRIEFVGKGCVGL